MIIQERLEEVMRGTLASGSHKSYEDGMCILEAASYVAGEPWSDTPQCACPVIGVLLRSWNDGLPDDATRDRLLKALIPQIVGTRSTAAVEERRSYLALDWLVRVHAPAWLDLRPELTAHAKALRELESIADSAGAIAAGKVAHAAWAAAGAAARAAAGDAAGAAAGDAAWAAAAAAARAAAATAAGDAAWAAAWAAAAAAAAAGDAAALKSTIASLQASALQLVRDMIDVRSGASMTETQ